MFKSGEAIQLSASDLVGHLNCRHLTKLDLDVARGTLARPHNWDPLLEILRERGQRHEDAYIAHLKDQGHAITTIAGVGIDAAAVAATIVAMQAGADIIVQGALRHGQWDGRIDVLRRIDKPSNLGGWSYEVIDTKLARETKGGTVLQLCLYSDLVANVQGAMPEFAYVVVPWSDNVPQAYRIDDYGAYYRRVKNGLAGAVAEGAGKTYPDPIAHCDACRWNNACDARRRADDHLSLVANISRLQILELGRHDASRVVELAGYPTPFPWKPARGAVASYERVREQARIQVEARGGGMRFETLPVVAGFGLSLLPEPSPGDIFFDLEGDPFVGETGIEYLFGYSFLADDHNPAHMADWGLSRAEEKAVFERFVDFVAARRVQFPDLHVYHYAPYEPAALKRLMGRHATREEEVDALLRGEVFVDLYGVVRQGIRASVESYSIKRLEPLYQYERVTPLSAANFALTKLSAGLELDDLDLVSADDRAAVQSYNRDDCVSTWRLRDWLEAVRADRVNAGEAVPRPAAPDGEASENVAERQAKVAALMARLLADVPADPAERTEAQQANWLLAQELEWHRREAKAIWWEYFRLADLSAEDLVTEKAALAGLEFVEVVEGGTAKAPIHRYRFPTQDTDLRGKEDLHRVGGEKLGSVVEVSLEHRTIDIKKRTDSATIHPDAVFGFDIVRTGVQADALLRLGTHVADHGVDGPGAYYAARRMLLKLAPEFGGASLREAGETTLAAGVRIAPLLDGVLPIQGPPGAGKTHTGAHMICALIRAGKTVGISANSHKVIRNLLDKVIETATGSGISLECIQRVPEKADTIAHLSFSTDNAATLAAIGPGCSVAGGTSFFWALPDAVEVVDVLFVDEAAQMSLANVLAIAHAAKNIVLLGDPRQLEQPTRGSHPDGSDLSALDHLLDGAQTVAADRGLFLEETWRLHPDICAFTSELFYERRLTSHAGLAQHQVRSTGRIAGSGLRYLAVPHTGNQSSSIEEADAVEALVHELLKSQPTWVDGLGQERPMTLSDILIIAPYNAQVSELQERIPGGRVGTVDKFQGQEAPVVIYSVTTSTYADAPRGMEFLYSPNRLNVASSRAKCLCILIAAPAIFEAECKTPQHMKLANPYCRYAELAAAL